MLAVIGSSLLSAVYSLDTLLVPLEGASCLSPSMLKWWSITSSLSVKIPRQWLPPLCLSLPLCLAPSLLPFYLFLSLPFPSHPPPHLFLPAALLVPSLPFLFICDLRISLLPTSSPPHFFTCLYSGPLHRCQFASFSSIPPLSVLPSHLAFPQQQQMRFPFTDPPFLASLHVFLPPSLSCSMHSSLLPLRALFCLNQELKCCILTQTMPAIQSGPVQIGVPCKCASGHAMPASLQ